MAEYSEKERVILLQTANESIKHGLEHNTPLPIQPQQYPAHLQETRACFVTIDLHNQLRGCIGSLAAHQPLIIDTAMNAFAAAFKDPRFKALNIQEYNAISLHISVLSKPEPMHFSSEADLISQLKPNIDGLILSDKAHRGTFLPSVWEQLPDPQQFLQHLKNKAGLPTNYWSSSLTVERYSAEMIE